MGLICTCQGCGVKLDAVRKCVLFSAGFFAFVHGALLAGRIMGSSSESTDAVMYGARPLSGNNYTDPDSLPEDDDVSCRPREATSCSWEAQWPLPRASLPDSTHATIEAAMCLCLCLCLCLCILSPQPLDTAMRIVVNGVALIGN
eukprot:COSAG02_NODE_38122_length_433_cov_0.667665_1_plen_144_part_11